MDYFDTFIVYMIQFLKGLGLILGLGFGLGLGTFETKHLIEICSWSGIRSWFRYGFSNQVQDKEFKQDTTL
eukprot:8585157-Ditylum_brightwellii.AAC.1